MDLLAELDAASRSPHGTRLLVTDPQAFRAAFDLIMSQHVEYHHLYLRVAPYNPSEIWIVNGKTTKGLSPPTFGGRGDAQEILP